jgi:hypothetical protein
VGAFVSLLFSNPLLGAVERGQPDVVISTYPLGRPYQQEAHGEGIRVIQYECLVADHRHLVHVSVVRQLREHKGRNIRTRYCLRAV